MKAYAIIVLALIGEIVSIANAEEPRGDVRILADTDTPQSHLAEITLTHQKGGSSIDFIPWPPPAIDGYLLQGGNKYKRISKEPNNVENANGKYQTTGINVEGPAWWKSEVEDPCGLFDKYNMIVKIFEPDANINNPDANLITIFDANYHDSDFWDVGGWFQSGTFPDITNGIFGQPVVAPYLKGDLTREKGIVNFRAYAVFADNWGRTDTNCGADPNNLDDYSDINRDGVVDYNDLDLFSDEWLWDANDPNAW
jgi:hypothetical protein